MEHWVSFPALGWKFDLPQSVVQFELFGIDIDIRWYGLLIAIGFLSALVYAYVRAPKLGIDRDRMMDVVLVTAVVAVITTRLYYVLFSDPAYYFSHPAKILAIWDGGLGIYGGIIGAFVCGFIMCRIKKLSARTMFDLAAVGFAMGQGIGRWGNFFNQEAYGCNTTLPWGMTGDIIQQGVNGVVEDQTAPVHPTFLYESLWCLLGAVLLHIMFVKMYRFRGQIFASYIIWYGMERAVVEGLRTDSLHIPGTPIRVSQVVAIVAVLIGIALWILLPLYDKKRAQKVACAVTDAQETTTIALNESDTETAADTAEEQPTLQDVDIEEDETNGNDY